jgi:nicotinate-nucleotide pyrophosphorylase (carboxylating)
MTLKEFYSKHDKQIDDAIKRALVEDRVKGDITTSLVFKSKEGNRIINAKLLCKEDCALAGLDIFKRVYKTLYSGVRFKGSYRDGQKIKSKSVILEVKSPLKILLEGERTSLNFLQRMSGIATLTNEFVKSLKYKNAKILHTRKTTPNFRLFELAAVKTGGGDFHRFDLSSAVMIKDNHIEAVGSVDEVLRRINSKKLTDKEKYRFEIEVKSIKELKQVLKEVGKYIKIVMLDNFHPSDIAKAVRLLRKYRIKTELSGGITLRNFKKLQMKGIDYYSIGMLTHSYKSIDFSLEF